MLRCVLLFLCALVIALPVSAQGSRSFPKNALRGQLTILQPPEANLNGQPARLAPGARIRGENNLLQMSAALAGLTLIVHYTVDDFGQIKDVWLLTEAERARKPWPTTLQQAQTWAFDPVAQVWTSR